MAAVIMNQSFHLQFASSLGHALATNTEIVGDLLLCYRQIITRQTIKTQQEPAA